MAVNGLRRAAVAGALAGGMVLGSIVPADAETVTQRFTGVGGSDFGLALFYARQDARAQAVRAGFTDPDHQCTEIHRSGSPYLVRVVWGVHPRGLTRPPARPMRLCGLKPIRGGDER